MIGSFFKLIIFATINFHCLSFTLAEANETERVALLGIKARISRDPSKALRSWNETVHYCQWRGVTCELGHSRVIGLNLQSLNLEGTLASQVGNLSFLTVLQLQNNRFSGTIPSELGRLSRLKQLLLFDNHFQGEIPPRISGCSSLVELDLNTNRLAGRIPSELGMIPNLQKLSLAKNKLTGEIPSSLGNLTFLTKLSFSGNNLVGQIPNTFGRLKSLTFLTFFSNTLSGLVPPSIFNLSLLRTLDFGDNHFVGKLPSQLCFTLPNLRIFSIYKNNFTGYIPTSISNCSKLETFQLASNRIQGQIPPLRSPQLKYLILFDNLMGTGQADDWNFVSSLANASMLEVFDIAENNFEGILPATICNLPSLKKITVYKNNIGGKIPICIGNLTNLELFNAWGNQLTGVIPLSVGKLENLNEFDLSFNGLSGYIPSSIGNLTKLTVLSLAVNYLEGHIPLTIRHCTNLLALDLSYNNLSGIINPQLFSITTLSIALHLNNNQLSGSLPEEVSKLINLVDLDVSENLLAGEIPSSLSSCVGLEFLLMEGNNFQGAIPVLSTLKGLQELDVSRNNLSGNIPKFLATLNLRKLNISYNNFEGEVPIDGVFKNVTGVLLLGNNRLCGGMPEFKMPKCNFKKSRKRRLSHTMRLVLVILCGISAFTVLAVSVILWNCVSIRKKKEVPATSSDLENPPLNLSYQTLSKATNGFSSENMVGSGTFGVVYRGKLDQINKIVAVKVFNLEHRGGTKSFIAECGVLKSIRHRNLVRVITACSSLNHHGKDFKALVYEYMVNGSLEDWLHPKQVDKSQVSNNQPRYLNFIQRVNITLDVALALEYLHHNCGRAVVHCDLKPSNVLLDEGMVARVGDFGLAKFLSKDITRYNGSLSSSIGVRGTIGYTPPEYGLGYDISTRGDVYSFGILVLEMFTGKRPTSEMFREGLSLYKYVKGGLLDDVALMVDETLIEEVMGDKTRLIVLLRLILEIAVCCSDELPHQRLDMKEVVSKLSSARDELVMKPYT